MKLTFLGRSYEVPASIQIDSNSAHYPQIQLIYRGNTFQCTLPLETVAEGIEMDEPIVSLIYRGNTYDHKLQPPSPIKGWMQSTGGGSLAKAGAEIY
jgi:hypothetical protein